jgi:hypothetical protein
MLAHSLMPPLHVRAQSYFTLTLAKSDTVRIGSRERVPFSNSLMGALCSPFDQSRMCIRVHAIIYVNMCPTHAHL